MNRRDFLRCARLIPLAVIALPACAVSPESAALTGATLTLNTAITVDAHRATAYIQGGRVTPPPELDRYHAHCVIELRQVRDVARRIEPDRFTVSRVRTDVYHAGAAGPYLAALKVGADATPGYMMWTTELYLRSDRQPDVLRLSCQHLEDPASLPRHVTIAEMRKALGEIATLETGP